VNARTLAVAGRWIFGLFYFATGVAIVLATAFGIGHPPRQPTAAAEAFTQALTASRFMDPLVAFAYLAGGAALLRLRTAPPGVVLLAPVVTSIFCFHLVLSGQWIWGSLNLAWLLALAWSVRPAFAALWSFRAPVSPPAG
jgi:hypothetical protein